MMEKRNVQFYFDLKDFHSEIQIEKLCLKIKNSILFEF